MWLWLMKIPTHLDWPPLPRRGQENVKIFGFWFTIQCNPPAQFFSRTIKWSLSYYMCTMLQSSSHQPVWCQDILASCVRQHLPHTHVWMLSQTTFWSKRHLMQWHWRSDWRFLKLGSGLFYCQAFLGIVNQTSKVCQNLINFFDCWISVGIFISQSHIR